VSSPESYSEDSLLIIDSNGSFCCPTCDLHFESFVAASQSHPACNTWSCRYLHDGLSILKNSTKCRLCGDLDIGKETSAGELTDHADRHQLRKCTQTIYTTSEEFAEHLNLEHGLTNMTKPDMAPWERLQFLEIMNGEGLVRTTRVPTDGACCQSVKADYSFTFVSL
jgi:hypothetical protein